MQVTAVITTYKRTPAMVERALTSVLNQTRPVAEIFVIDDSPLEYEQRHSVEQMVKGYADKCVTYIKTDGDLGACASRNIGLERASCEFIAFLDDDDEWLPEKIEKQLPLFSSPDIVLVYCGSYTVNDDKETRAERKLNRHRGKVFDKLMLENFIESTSFPLIRTAALREIGGFDPLMPASQDLDVWLRLSERFEIDYVDEPLVCYHVHSGERITRNYSKKIAGTKRIIEKNQDYLNSHPKALAKLNHKLLMPYILLGDLSSAFSVWIKAVSLNFFDIKANFKGFGRLIKGLIGMYK